LTGDPTPRFIDGTHAPFRDFRHKGIITKGLQMWFARLQRHRPQCPPRCAAVVSPDYCALGRGACQKAADLARSFADVGALAERHCARRAGAFVKACSIRRTINDRYDKPAELRPPAKPASSANSGLGFISRMHGLPLGRTRKSTRA